MKDIDESEVDVNETSRSGSNTRPERERVNLGKERGNKIRDKLGLGPDDPISEHVIEILDKWVDDKVLSLNPEDYLQLVRYTQSRKMSMDVVAPTIILRGIELNLFHHEAFTAARDAIAGNKFEFLDLCPQLRFRDKDYVCVHARPGKSPEIKRIAGSDEGTARVCDGCITDQKRLAHEDKQIAYIETLETRECNLESRWNEILEKDRQGVTTDHTYCTAGSEFDEKGDRIKCTLVNAWISTDECFVIDGGKVCPSLKTLRSRPTKKTGIKRRTPKNSRMRFRK